MSENLTLYKLMILFMLDKVDTPLTAAQISNFILGNDYTTYFTLQQTLSELENSNLVSVESTLSSTLLKLTDTGADTLSYFDDKISEGIKQDILQYLDEKKLEIKDDVSILADYYKTTENTYSAKCQIREKNSPIIDLTMTFRSKEQAAAVCEQWKNNSANVYEYLMDTLLK